MKRIFISLTFLLFTLTAFAQPKHKYQFLGGDAKSFFWKNEAERFQRTEVPEKWKKESAVYLNLEVHYETKATSSRGRGISYLAHFRVKILDQAALTDFSEVYLNTQPHGFYTFGSGIYSRQKDFFGLKIVKSDGKEIVMSEDDLIETEDNQKKMAIANLEIGDIIDYWIFNYDYTTGDNIYAVFDKFPLETEYPILELNYNLVADKHWNVSFLTKDTGTEVKEEKVGFKNKDYSFSFQKKDLEPISSTRWHYPYQSSPYLKLYVKYERNFLEEREKSFKPWHSDKFEGKDLTEAYLSYTYKDPSARNNYNAFERYLKKAGKTNLSKKEKLEEWYYNMRYFFINTHYVYDRFHGKRPRHVSAKQFTGHIIYGLTALDIDYDLIVVMPRRAGDIVDVVDPLETDYIIRADLANDEFLYFYKPSPFTRFNYYPSIIEDTEGYIVKGNTFGSTIKPEKVTLPKSKYQENIIEYVTTVSFDEEEPTLLNTSTTATYNGHQMFDYQAHLIDWIKMIWDENDLYGDNHWGNPKNERGKDKVELEEFIAADYERRKENFKYIAGSHFDVELEEIKDFEAYNTGNKIGEKNLKVRFDCDLKDFVNKVGPNYVLKAGLLVGAQVTFDESDFERNNDVYMDYARGYDYTVKIKIPEGYEVKGLDNFKNDVENEAGILRSSATLEGDIVTVLFKKIYKSNYEPAENWPLMLAFLKPGSEFGTKELLLKKK